MRAALILLALLAAPATGFSADKAAPAQKPAAAVEAAKAQAESIPSLGEILAEIETLDTSERRLGLLLAEDKRLPALTAEVAAIERELAGARRLAGKVAKDDLIGFHELVDLGTSLRVADQRLAEASDDLTSRANALDAGLDRITASGARIQLWLEAARKRNASPALRARIEALIPRHAALSQQLQARRDQVLDVLGKAMQLNDAVGALRDEVSEHRDRVSAQLRTERSAPIWRVDSQGGEWDRVMRFFDVQVAQSFRHALDHAALLFGMAVVAFAFTYWLIVSTRGRLAAQVDADPLERRVRDVFQLPATAAFVAALVSVMAYGPQGPINYHHMLWALLPLPGVMLARAAIGPALSLSLFTVAAVAISQDLLGALLDPLPIAGRLLLITQCVALGIALGADLRRGRFGQSFLRLPATAVQWAVAGIVVLLAGAVLAAVFGFLGVARVARNLVLGALALSLILAVAAELVYGLTLALMHTSVGRRLEILRLHGGDVKNIVRKVLTVASVAGWLSGMLVLLGMWDESARIADALYHAEFKIGSITIGLAGVWTGLAVILATIVLMRIVAPLLQLEILPRLTRKPGLPFAITTVTRYLLMMAGVLLAMAAMGLDLTKVSLLAGALGVGIGFGLQSVVNNFVSGLILLVERPVNIGDVVQLGQLRGTVLRIGVRSSTVATGSGAEVIVPNADLISKEVTNWTLSDRKRLLEVDVSVAHGVEPERVAKLLEAAAAEVAEVLAYPAPQAACTGLVDSAMKFRVSAWVADYGQGAVIESALRMAVVRKLRAEGIEFPSPPPAAPAKE